MSKLQFFCFWLLGIAIFLHLIHDDINAALAVIASGLVGAWTMVTT